MKKRNRFVAATAVPWSVFVAGFVYFSLVTLFAIGLDQPSDLMMGTAYLLPVALYAIWLSGRAALGVQHAVAGAYAAARPAGRDDRPGPYPAAKAAM